MEQQSQMGPPPTPTTTELHPPSYAESVAETIDVFFYPDWHYRGGCDDSMVKTLDDLLNKDLSFMHPGTDFFAFYSFLLKMGEQRMELWTPDGRFQPIAVIELRGPYLRELRACEGKALVYLMHPKNEQHVKECYFIVQETILSASHRSGVAGKLVSLFDKSKQVERKYWIKAALQGESYIFRQIAPSEEPMPEECVGVKSICYQRFWP
ncbi:hypothetical protein BDV32DRAFT_154245 [Aspergillus pseudonomiae]|uniref:Uncharacterized protein n=1 Tax=Aspergillus pseudonomiae TaxID=1506151 RepID=A0A5N7DKS6_9EURO|nr:uncharacterized protein BDV37DRAFT_280667 [Aspergillus pseudonomiae]KAB8255472.1 hypothetical protein BDV32DRAFT_154245 [Aspergillus pseudonomiae]KAE8406709.1 hypothetical protein BDV37DRAFT_280667 [Aspergillus pseudonomiae]